VERIAELRAAVAGRVNSTHKVNALRVALSTLVERFELRPVFGDGSPDVAYLDLCLTEADYVLVPTLRDDAIAGHTVHTGDREVTLPEPRRVALDLGNPHQERDPALSQNVSREVPPDLPVKPAR